MNWLGNLLIIVGISFDIYAAMEIRGAMLAKIKPKALILASLIITLIQCVFFFGGFFISYGLISHDQMAAANARPLGNTLAAIIFFALAVRLIHKAIRHEEIEEKREEMSLKTYSLIVLVGAVYILFAGLACGLTESNIWLMLITIVVSTIVVVSAGVYTGYRYGFASRPRVYLSGAALLIIAGVWSIIRSVIS